MELNSSAALISAVISAITGFGLAFYLQSKLNKKYTKKSQKFFSIIGTISLGYGVTIIANELIGFPLQGLRVRTGNIILTAIFNVIIIPLIMYAIVLILNIGNKIKSDSQNEVIGDKTIDDESWKLAYEELNGTKDTATWAKSYAESSGDEKKASALYIKYRASALQQKSNKSLIDTNLKCIQNEKYSNIKYMGTNFMKLENGNFAINIGGFYYLYDSEKSILAAIDKFSFHETCIEAYDEHFKKLKF